MNLNVLEAKIKRNNLVKHAGKFYIDRNSELIKKINAQGNNALFGIQNVKKGVYTVVGEQYVYYLTSKGISGKILLKEFIGELHENGCRIGTGYLKFKFFYKNIVLKNNDKVWLHNSDTMFSLWNTIIWLEGLSNQHDK